MSVMAASLLQMGALLSECVECRIELVYAPEFQMKLAQLGFPVQVGPNVGRIVISTLVLPPMQLQSMTARLDRHFAPQAQKYYELADGGRFYIDILDEHTLAFYCLHTVAVLGMEGAEIRTRRRTRNRSRGRTRSRERQREMKEQLLAHSIETGNFELASRLRDELRAMGGQPKPQ